MSETVKVRYTGILGDITGLKIDNFSFTLIITFPNYTVIIFEMSLHYTILRSVCPWGIVNNDKNYNLNNKNLLDLCCIRKTIGHVYHLLSQF